MSTPASNNQIIVGVDGSPQSKVAVDWAARDAAMRRAPLTTGPCSQPAGGDDLPRGAHAARIPASGRRRRGRRSCDGRRDRHARPPEDHPIEVTSEMVSGPAVPTLVDLSKDAQLLVVGCRGHGALARGLLGSVSSGLVHHAHCPVAIIHDEDPLMPHPSKAPVVVGVDGSPASELAVCHRVRGSLASAEWTWWPCTRGATAGVFEFPGVDWSTLQAAGRGDPQRAARRLAGALPRCAGAPRRRRRPARPPAHRAVRVGAAAGGRQPRPRRLRRDAARFGQHRGGQCGPDAGDRRAVTMRPRPRRSRRIRFSEKPLAARRTTQGKARSSATPCRRRAPRR